MPPHIRLTTPADLPAINAIYNHYVLHSTCTYQLTPSTAEERQDWFQQHADAYPVTVAESAAGEIVGWASLSPFQGRPGWRFTVENSVYVHPDHQRRHVGSELLADIVARADRLQYRSVIAIISADQTPSLALHQKHGFVPAAHLKNAGYKFDRWLDVIYLQRENPSHNPSIARTASLPQ